MKNLLFIAILLSVVFLCFGGLPGAKKEYKGEPTADHRRAIELVLGELKLRHNEEFKLVKIMSIHEQVVNGKNYFFHMMVACEAMIEYELDVVVHHKFTDEMTIQHIKDKSPHAGKHTHGEVTPIVLKAVDAVISHQTDKYKEGIMLVRLNTVHSQVVSGVRYQLDMVIKGKFNVPEHQIKAVVHHTLNDELVVDSVEKVEDKKSWWNNVFSIVKSWFKW
ncbi:hypothetical protein AKO1_005098 [Acrasis kona]|uniref:Cystatin domain-containing protein n=1 Tax=Acrasis kona TaxID=1008807 RepID=A0AAW2Z755_9EUKA